MTRDSFLLVIPAKAGIQPLLWLVIPAEAGIQCLYLALDLLEGASLRFSARIRASGSLFFACTKKSNQKKCPPGAAPSALRAAGAQGQAGVRSMGILPIRELARIPARDPIGRFRPALAAADGAQDQEQRRVRLFCSGFCAQDARALLSPGSPWPCGGSGRSGPAGVRARDRAHSAVAQGCAISGTRPLARTRRARCA